MYVWRRSLVRHADPKSAILIWGLFKLCHSMYPINTCFLCHLNHVTFLKECSLAWDHNEWCLLHVKYKVLLAIAHKRYEWWLLAILENDCVWAARTSWWKAIQILGKGDACVQMYASAVQCVVHHWGHIPYSATCPCRIDVRVHDTMYNPFTLCNLHIWEGLLQLMLGYNMQPCSWSLWRQKDARFLYYGI